MIYNIKRLLESLISNDIDVLIASTAENINYFTGFQPVIKVLNRYHGECYVVIHRDNPNVVNLVHSCGECDQITECRSDLGLVYTYGTFYREVKPAYELKGNELDIHTWTSNSPRYLSAQHALHELLGALGVKGAMTIGCDEDGMPHSTLQSLKEKHHQCRIIPCSLKIRDIRKVKTPYEIDMLTKAAICNEAAIKTVANSVYEGITEQEIQNIFESAIVDQGGRPELTMIKIGKEAVGGQRRQRNDVALTTSDIIWFDSNTTYQGFWADLARVCAFRDVSDSVARKYSALQLGMRHAAKTIKSGMSGAQIFESAMEVIKSAGFSNYRRHHIGHGIGLEAYERPILSPNEAICVEDGMVISLETPYYEFGFGALHLEDPLLVGEKGNRFLTFNPCPDIEVLG